MLPWCCAVGAGKGWGGDHAGSQSYSPHLMAIVNHLGCAGLGSRGPQALRFCSSRAQGPHVKPAVCQEALIVFAAPRPPPPACPPQTSIGWRWAPRETCWAASCSLTPPFWWFSSTCACCWRCGGSSGPRSGVMGRKADAAGSCSCQQRAGCEALEAHAGFAWHICAAEWAAWVADVCLGQACTFEREWGKGDGWMNAGMAERGSEGCARYWCGRWVGAAAWLAKAARRSRTLTPKPQKCALMRHQERGLPEVSIIVEKTSYIGTTRFGGCSGARAVPEPGPQHTPSVLGVHAPACAWRPTGPAALSCLPQSAQPCTWL